MEKKFNKFKNKFNILDKRLMPKENQSNRIVKNHSKLPKNVMPMEMFQLL